MTHYHLAQVNIARMLAPIDSPVMAGHIPTVEEGRDRLAFRRLHGDTPVAFSFVKSYPAPDEPAADSAAPQVSASPRSPAPAN